MSVESQVNLLAADVRDKFNAVGTLDRPGGYVAGSPGVRRAAFSFGNGGEGTFTDRDTAWQRLPVQLPVATTRWRLRFSNRNPAGVASAGTWSIGPIHHGTTFRSLYSGDPTGWTGTLTQAVAAGPTTAGNGEYLTPWVTDPAVQFSQPGTLYTISHTWSKAAGSTCYYGSGGSWYSTTMADSTATAPGFTYWGGTAFNVTLEYEFIGNQKIGVAVGDSITEGYGARFNFMSWHQVFSMQHGIPMCMSADWGSQTNDWVANAVTEPRWKQIKDAGLNIDFGINALGTNDASVSVAIGTFQTNLNTVSSRMTSEWGIPWRNRYAVTIAAAGRTGTPETTRVAYNSWLRSGQPFTTATFDFADALDNGTALRTDSSMDGLHWNPVGHYRASNTIFLS